MHGASSIGRCRVLPSSLERLLEIASPPLGDPVTDKALSDVPGSFGDQLGSLLAGVNGFFAFESALHLFPRGVHAGGLVSIESWNSEQLWRQSYRDMAAGLFFFAEDVFGGQFAVADDRVVTFDPETGEIVEIASSLEGWANVLLADPEFYTAFPLAHQWQLHHRALRHDERLVPKRPFVLGGAFAAENLYPLDAVEGMRLRGEIAHQLRDLPDGTSVSLKTVD
jgi:hypothetical protein